MVVKVRRLNRVHGAQHRNAERDHREIGEPAPESERVVIGVVQAGQEEEERAQQRRGGEARMGGFSEVPAHQRSGEPRSRDQGFADDLTAGERQEVPPLHGPEAPVEDLPHA